MVKKAVGFEETRGDTITLVTAPFSKPSAVEEIPELPIWEQPWFWSTVKQGLAGLVVLMLIFGVLRPAFRNLTSREMDAQQAEVRGGEADGEDQELLAPPNPKVQQLEAIKEKYDEDLGKARLIADDDPKLVAQVVKGWVDNSGA